MVQQEAQTDAHCKKVCDSNKKNQKVPFNKNKGGKYKKYNNNTHKNSDKDHKKNRKLSNDDACPIHGGSHTWG